MLSLLSVVVPCHNEQDSVTELVSEVMRCAHGAAAETEIILVDDGSRDSTAAVAERIAATTPGVRLISFSRNFGKEAAMLAGLRAARGEAVVIMDGDLQHPPALLPTLIERFEQGYDQVLAKRDRTGDPWVRSQVSRLYYRLVDGLMDVRLEDGVGDFRLMSRRAVDAVLSLTESNRFSKGLFAWVGFPTTTVPYRNVERGAGATSWSTASLINYGIDGVVSFNTKPLRAAVHLGLVSFGLFVLYLIWLVAAWAMHGIELPGYITTIAVVVGIGGIQLLFLGVIGEYVGRIYNEVKRRPHYLVALDTAVARESGARADR